MGRASNMLLALGAIAGLLALGSTQASAQASVNCSRLSAGDFEQAGEAWMGRALGSTQAHRAMNALMSSMMGSAGEEQMHEYMGRRATGCGGGTIPPGFARMMGMMGLAAGVNGPQGMMGSTPGGYQGSGPMMGGFSRSSDGNTNGDDDGPSAAAMIGMMAVLIGAVALVLAAFRPWRRSSPDGQQVLDRRLAAGEISPAEYRKTKSLLDEGGSR